MPNGHSPRVWVLVGGRTGDNAQARELARRLGWPHEIRQLGYNPLRALPNLLLGASLAALDRRASDRLAPPWPDLVIGVGRRSVSVARWIQRQSGRTAKLVQIGRPRAPLAWFDLVLTTPQYGLPPSPNVIELPLPLVSPPGLPESDLENWRVRFAELPRPWTGVLVGGSRYPFLFTPRHAERLAARLAEEGGTALVSTSPRTGRSAAAALRSRLPAGAFIHEWSRAGPNPHQAILCLADRFVVTSDSISMMAEAAATGKPVEMFEVGHWPSVISWDARQGFGAYLARHGLLVPPRRAGAVRPVTDESAIAHAVSRVKELVAARA